MELPGDVMIGGVFNVHAADPDSPFSCGAINVANGFQYTEALRFALDSINKVQINEQNVQKFLTLPRDPSQEHLLEDLKKDSRASQSFGRWVVFGEHIVDPLSCWAHVAQECLSECRELRLLSTGHGTGVTVERDSGRLRAGRLLERPDVRQPDVGSLLRRLEAAGWRGRRRCEHRHQLAPVQGRQQHAGRGHTRTARYVPPLSVFLLLTNVFRSGVFRV